uniref:Facilitated trehalose transporter Tret1 n=1 Tax=Lygus hesperus TaxID=30085 RepID=A0A0A9WEY9_LYGHE
MALTSGDEVPNAGLVKQIISTFIISTLPLNAGLATGWVSPMSLKLTSQDSPVGVMSKEEISYLATLPNYVGFVLSFVFGLLSNRLGRKWALLAVGIPAMISGAVLTFGTSKTSLYVGRVLAGFTIIGGLTTPHAYISETVHQSIRGMFMCSSMVQINIGVLVSYTLGKVLDYKAYNSILIVLPLLNTVALLWLPETPYFLVTMNRMNEALNSLIWLRGGNVVIAKREAGNYQT